MPISVCFFSFSVQTSFIALVKMPVSNDLTTARLTTHYLTGVCCVSACVCMCVVVGRVGMLGVGCIMQYVLYVYVVCFAELDACCVWLFVVAVVLKCKLF